jgi:hypothetical protein
LAEYPGGSVDKKTYSIRTLSAESYRNVESMIYRVSGKQ